jgi:hypothetical protein
MQSNTIINKNRHGVLLYGTASGYRDLGSLNVENPKYLDDLIDISNSFDLSIDTTILSVTAGSDQTTIFTLYSRVEDGRGRDGFYAISLFYYGLIPSSDLVFEQLFLFQNEFNTHILQNSEIQISRIEKIQSLLQNIPELQRKHYSKKTGNYFSVIQISKNITLGEITDSNLYSFIDEINWGKSLFVCKVGKMKANNLYVPRNGSYISVETRIFDQDSYLAELLNERMTKRFSFTPLSNQNTIVPGLLTLSFGDRYAEKRVYSTAIFMEFIVDDNINGNLIFKPDDTNKYEKYEETKPFTQLSGYQGSILSIKIEERPYKKIEIKSDVPIYGLKVSCNSREIFLEQGYYKIYDQSGLINITSTSHLPKDLDISVFKDSDTITLLSNSIELEICEGNNKIPFSKDIEILANGKTLSTNYINRSDLPIKIEVNSKKYINGPSNIPKDFPDSKHSIYLINSSKNIKVIGSKMEVKNSGIIGPEKRKPWYYEAKGIGLIISGLLLIILLGYFLWPNEIITPTCDNIVQGTPQFREYCNTDSTCVKCKPSPRVRPESPIIVNDSTKIKIDSSNLELDSTSYKKPIEEPETSVTPNKQQNKNIISCENFSTKSIKEKKSFCKDSKNKNCPHCFASCKNYKHLSEEIQESYCNNPATNCEKCPKTEVQNKTTKPVNGTSEDKKEDPIECSDLDDIPVNALETACKNGKYKMCAKCKK